MPGVNSPDAALLDTLLREAPLGFALLGTDLRFRRVNHTLAKLYGHSPGDYAGRLPAQVWPPAVAARAESAIREVLARNQPVSETVPLAVPGAQSPDGQAGGQQAGRPAGPAGTWLFSWFPAHDPAGRMTGVALAAVDITGQQMPEEAIRRSEERYRSLVQGGAQVVWVATPEGDIAEDCPQWRWITGQSAEEYLDGGWLAVVHPEDRPRVERRWQECVRTGRLFEDRYRIRAKGGSYRHYDVRAVPVEHGGKIVEWVGASTDVTGQREAEEMRGRLTDQLSAAALRTARLQQATSMLAEALTVEQVAEVITEIGRTAIGAQRSAVALLDPGRLRLRVVNPDGMPPGPAALGMEIPLSVPGVMARAVTTRRPVLAEDLGELRALVGTETPVPESFGVDERSWAGLPLLAAGAPLGALRFAFGRPRKISEEERVFLEALAGQCALAVERAIMYEREHTTAETLQRSLLPDQLPRVPGLVMEARYLPVSKNMEIGGDWYDVFRIPGQRLAVAVGDVMGKGLPAAAGMGRVRNALRALALTDPEPAAVLTGLDRLFSATEMEEQVTTVAYLVIDPETGEGFVGNAGHPPVLLLAAGERPRLGQTEAGTPLGWPSQRQQHPFRLPPGSTAVFYSDGLVENRRRGLDDGLDELVAVAAQAPDEAAGRPDKLLEYLVGRKLAGYEQDDDVTVLVLHVPERGKEDQG